MAKRQALFMCGVCKKDFVLQRNLEIHMREHGRTKHRCYRCHKSFASISDLHLHIQSHNEEIMIPCKGCQKLFWTTNELRRHMHQQHAVEEKPHVCEICGEAFSEALALETHVESHDGEKKFLCSICWEAFLLESNLMKHVQNWHNGGKLCKISCVFSLSRRKRRTRKKPS